MVPDLPTFSPLRLTKMRQSIFATQIIMAKLCRVPVATWRSWENGNRNISEATWAYVIIQHRKVKKRIFEMYPHMEKLGIKEAQDIW